MRTDGHSRRAFLRGIATAAATAAMPGWTQTMSSNRERPDVLFIAIEDVKTCFGCYGHPICRTPNLDAFARSGVRFDNAQCQAPVCNPTRSSMLTGLYPSTTKVFGNSQDWNEYIPLGTSMPGTRGSQNHVPIAVPYSSRYAT